MRNLLPFQTSIVCIFLQHISLKVIGLGFSFCNLIWLSFILLIYCNSSAILYFNIAFLYTTLWTLTQILLNCFFFSIWRKVIFLSIWSDFEGHRRRIMVNSGVKGKAYNGLEGKSDWSKMLKEDILEIKMGTFSEIKNIQGGCPLQAILWHVQFGGVARFQPKRQHRLWK